MLRTVWPDECIFFNYCPFTRANICPITYFFAKVGSKFCQVLNKPFKTCQRCYFFPKCQNLAIWSHLTRNTLLRHLWLIQSQPGAIVLKKFKYSMAMLKLDQDQPTFASQSKHWNVMSLNEATDHYKRQKMNWIEVDIFSIVWTRSFEQTELA